MDHINGRAFTTYIGSLLIQVLSFSVTISDSSKPYMRSGIPVGNLPGDVSASGEIEVDSQMLGLLVAEAKKSGSIRQMPPFDIVSNAETNTAKVNVEVFGCKITVSDLLSLDSNSTEATTHKLPYYVTSEDFIKLNGVPYLSAEETKRAAGN